MKEWKWFFVFWGVTIPTVLGLLFICIHLVATIDDQFGKGITFAAVWIGCGLGYHRLIHKLDKHINKE